MNTQNQAILKHRFISLILSIALIASLFIGLPVDRLLADSDNYVQNLKASVDQSTREVTVHWDKKEDADGYYIFRMFDYDDHMYYIAYTTQNEYREIPECGGFVYYLVIPFQIRDGKQYQGTYKTNTYSYTVPPKTTFFWVIRDDNEFQLHWDGCPGAVHYAVSMERNENLIDKTEIPHKFPNAPLSEQTYDFSYDGPFNEGDKFVFKVQPIYEGRGVTLPGAIEYTVYIVQNDKSNIPINRRTFPDPNFLDYVKQFDANKDGYFSEDEIANVKTIDVECHRIRTLGGVEYFTNLTTLKVVGNRLKELDVRNLKSLQVLDCRSNHEITNLDLSFNHDLQYVDISINKIEKLDLSNNPELVHVNVTGNPLSSLILTDCPNLKVLSLNSTNINNLDSIDLNHCRGLTLLSVAYMDLNSVDVSMLSNLEELNIESTPIGHIDLTQNKALKSLMADNAGITSIDTSTLPDLEYLAIYRNPLDRIDLSKNPKLRYLDASSCDLSSIDLSHNPELEKLYLDKNNLTELDLSHNPKLNHVDIRENSITQLKLSPDSHLESYDIYYSDNPLNYDDIVR